MRLNAFLSPIAARLQNSKSPFHFLLLATAPAALVLMTTPVANAAPGDLDPTFGSGGIVLTAIGSTANRANSVAIQPDGKIVAAGHSHNGTTTDFTVVRYNPDGSLDTTFDSDGKVITPIGSSTDQINSIAIQADGKIVAAGHASTPSNGNDFAVARYNTDGSLDLTFASGGKVTTTISSVNDQINSVAIQGDGKIVAAGYSHNGTTTDFTVVRYNPDGSLDTTFDSDGKAITPIDSSSADRAYSVALQGDGKIVAAGWSDNLGSSSFTLVRYNTDGSLDATFDSDGKVITSIGSGNDWANAVKIQADGKIVVAGYSTIASNGTDFALARYDSDGSLDSTFDSDGKVTTTITSVNDEIISVAIQADGKIVAAGYSSSGNDSAPAGNDFAVARYDTDGSLDLTFGSDGIVSTPIGTAGERAHSVAIQSDGRIVAAGYSNEGGGVSRFATIRYEGDSICGDGTTTLEEECDDGNILDGDCCSSTCQYEPPASPCPDANVCNGHETCDGAGTCQPGTPLDCTDDDLCTQDSCDPIDGCQNPAEPASTCLHTWAKGSLLVRETVAGREKLVAKFLKGPALTQADFGDPLDIDGTGYTTCIYDDEGALVESLHVDRAGLACAGKACWRELGTRGYSYKDRDASSDGIRQIRLVAGEEGKSRILIKAGNNSTKNQLNLSLGIADALSDSTSATVQLFRDDAPVCFSMTLDDIKKQDSAIFKARK